MIRRAQFAVIEGGRSKVAWRIKSRRRPGNFQKPSAPSASSSFSSSAGGESLSRRFRTFPATSTSQLRSFRASRGTADVISINMRRQSPSSIPSWSPSSEKRCANRCRSLAPCTDGSRAFQTRCLISALAHASAAPSIRCRSTRTLDPSRGSFEVRGHGAVSDHLFDLFDTVCGSSMSDPLAVVASGWKIRMALRKRGADEVGI